MVIEGARACERDEGDGDELKVPRDLREPEEERLEGLEDPDAVEEEPDGEDEERARDDGGEGRAAVQLVGNVSCLWARHPSPRFAS